MIARLAPAHGVELVNVTDEDEYFPPPRNIRELQSAIDLAATVMAGGSISGRPCSTTVHSTSQVLGALAR